MTYYVIKHVDIVARYIFFIFHLYSIKPMYLKITSIIMCTNVMNFWIYSCIFASFIFCQHVYDIEWVDIYALLT